ncbi:MAG: DUF2207 domain-containing protein [Acidimicrobiales bacterium]|nr:DUF2207 domain-containing protein [Acidimicrobiales bacterium]
MEYRKRRWVTIVQVVVAIAVLGLAAGAAAALGDTERITGYWAGAEVDLSGPDRVHEVIDYEFGVASRHGIYRDVPGLDPDSAVTVSSPTAPDQFVLESRFDETRIRIGSPVKTIRGRHRYEIDYRVELNEGFAFVGEAVSVAWDAVGDRWEVPISGIELHLVVAAELTDLRCSQGETGSWDGCTVIQTEPGHLVATIDKVGTGEGVTISGQVGRPLAAAPGLPPVPTGRPDDPGLGIVLPALIAALGLVGGAVLATPFVRRAGRELVWAGGGADAAFGPRGNESFDVQRIDHDKLADLATTEFAPPEELDAWQGGVLLAERVRPDHRVAWLLARSIDGQVDIEGQGKDVELVATDTTADDPLLVAMFGGRSTVELGKYDPQFAAAWKRVGRQLDDWQEGSNYWDPGGDQRRMKVRVFGILGALVGLAVAGFSAVMVNRAGGAYVVPLVIGAVLLGVSLAALLTSWELRVRTPHGSGLWLRVESFRRFVADSDARHVQQAAEMGLLLQYTAWAVALGEVDHWSEVVEQAGLEPEVSHRAMHYAAVAPNLHSATRAAATAPSSSGGGGGGSVGGGGGGGGGGSW